MRIKRISECSLYLLTIVAMDIQFEEEYIQKYANGKFYMRDEFYRQYTAEMLEMCDVPGM